MTTGLSLLKNLKIINHGKKGMQYMFVDHEQIVVDILDLPWWW